MSKLIKVAIIVAGIGAMLCFAGCGESSASTPDQFALQVVGKLVEGKADDAYLRNVCTKRVAGTILMCKEELIDKEARFEVVETKESGDKAVVKLKQIGGQRGNGKVRDVNLVKVEGVWKFDSL